MDGNTLTPHIRRYLRERRGAGSYNQKSLASVRGRLRSFDDAFGRRPLAQLNRRAVDRWLATLEHLAASSRSSYLASVRAFTGWLTLDGVVSVDPCLGVPGIRRPRSVPRAQPAAGVAAILAACCDSRDRAIVWMMVGCGLRRAEVAAAMWDDYDPEGATLLVRGKGGHERFLPVPDTVAHALTAVRVRGNSGPIIRNHLTGAPLCVETVGARVSQLMRDAGLKHAPYDGVSAHALRHTAASDVLDQCHDLRTVQAMLGHANLSSTAIYLRRANIGQLRDAMDGRDYMPHAA